MIPDKKLQKGIYWSKAWSLVSGCSPVSESCQNCWLASIEYRFDKVPGVLKVENGIRKPVFNGHVIFREDRLDIPRKTRKPQVFAIWSDLFHKYIHLQSINYLVMDIISTCETYKKGHIFLILTKRIERLLEFTKNNLTDYSNVFWGTTCENQQRADERIPSLLQVQGERFLSLEPLLGDINLYPYIGWKAERDYGIKNGIHQIIVGAESGPHRRPCKTTGMEQENIKRDHLGVFYF